MNAGDFSRKMTRKEPSHPARAKKIGEVYMKNEEVFYKIELLKSKKMYPRIAEIISGLKRIDYCKSEQAFYWIPYEKIFVNLFKKIGEEWPDLLSDYHWEQYLILSERTFDIIQENGLPNCKGFKVEIMEPYPEKLLKKDKPDYFVVDGLQLIGAEIDYEKSGLPNYTFCKECGTLRINVDDVINQINNGEKYPTVFKEDSWNGKMLFTVGDEKGYSYYCSEKFLEVVKKNKLTNLRFKTLDSRKTFSFF
jgi:hypothetical protein